MAEDEKMLRGLQSILRLGGAHKVANLLGRAADGVQ